MLKKIATNCTNQATLGRAHSVAALVLAAGGSSRMGQRNKLLEIIDGEPILHHVLNTVTACNLGQNILVSGYQADRIASSVSNYEISIVNNPNYKSGLSESIRTGLSAIDEKIKAVIILLGDMPDVSAKVINQLISNYDSGQEGSILVPTYNGKRGNPVLWSSHFFDKLNSIKGDIGGRDLIKQNISFVRECSVDCTSILEDIDTGAELVARQRKTGRAKR